MKQKPRSTKESLFSKDLIIEIVILGLTITGIVFGTWVYLMKNNYDLIEARSIVMMLMVFIQNINVLNCRSERRSIFRTPLNTNPLIFATIMGSIGLQLVMSGIPITAKFLNVVPLSFKTIFILIALSLIILVVFEVYKYIARRVKKD